MVDLKPIKNEVEDIIQDNQEIVIKSEKDYLEVGDLLKFIDRKIKSIESQRLSWTKPLDEAKKKIMDDVKTILNPLIDFKSKIKENMIVWWKEEKEKKDKEQEKLEEEALKEIKENKESEKEIEVVNDIKTKKGNFSTTTIKKVWDFEITDEEKVPKEYMAIDKTKIRKAIRDGVREIDGIKIFKKEQISIR